MYILLTSFSNKERNHSLSQQQLFLFFFSLAASATRTSKTLPFLFLSYLTVVGEVSVEGPATSSRVDEAIRTGGAIDGLSPIASSIILPVNRWSFSAQSLILSLVSTVDPAYMQRHRICIIPHPHPPGVLFVLIHIYLM